MSKAKHMVENSNPLVLSISTVVSGLKGEKRTVHNVHDYPYGGTFNKLVDTSRDNTWARSN